MPKYVIERNIPGAGKLSAKELQGISQTSCGVLREMGPQIQWVQSYVTDDKIYCIYIAPDEQSVREHAERGGFPRRQHLAGGDRYRPVDGRVGTLSPRLGERSRRRARACGARRPARAGSLQQAPYVIGSVLGHAR